jgi:hypothetical protein
MRKYIVVGVQAPLPGCHPARRARRSPPATATAWVRAEFRHPPAAPGTPGAMVALTNPVFLGPAEVSGPAPA